MKKAKNTLYYIWNYNLLLSEIILVYKHEKAQNPFPAIKTKL